jgi:PAS domain S-box-containing protein
MERRRIQPTGRERTFEREEIIVSKTDPQGIITYANDVFLRISGYSEREILGAPHSILRHPDMPRIVFAVLWEAIEAGREIFAYVKNMAANGDHYWVLAHVTPTWQHDRIVGYHSMRRWPEPVAVARFEALYADLLAVERRQTGKQAEIAASRAALADKLKSLGKSWNELMFSEM